MNQSINSEPMSQWISESTNKLYSELMSQWIAGWTNEWMDEWATSLRRYFFIEQPLRRGPSCLSNFSEQPLIWATSSRTLLWAASQLALLQLLQPNSSLRAAVKMHFATCSCKPAWHSTRVALWPRTSFRAAVTMRWATSSCNPACQEHRSAASLKALLRAAVPLGLVTACCTPAKQERRTTSTNVRAALTMGTVPRFSERARFLCFFLWSRALATVSCTFCRLHRPIVFHTWQFFNVLKCKSSSRHSPVHILSTTFLDRAADPRKFWRPQEPHYP